MRRWVLLAVVLAVAAAAVLVVRDVRRAEAALTEARELVSTARADLADGQVADARERLSTAVDRLATARRSVDGPLWAIAAAVPAAGDGPRTVRRVVDLADAAIGIAHTAVEQAAPQLFEDGEMAVLEGGAVDLDPLTGLASTLDSLPIASLETARQHLADTGSTLVPTRLVTARQDALGLADELAGLLEVGELVANTLPPFLGAEGPRSYLLAFQNPAELRGTGGLIGLIGVMRFDEGAFSLVPPSELQEADDRLEDTDLPAARASSAYERRYGPRDGTVLLQNANLDPDLPTVAPVLLDMWTRRVAADPLDGVIAIDPLLLADLVRATGPLELPDGFTEDPRIPSRLAADELLEVVTVTAYEVFGGDSPRRRAFLEAVSTAALDRLLTGGPDVSRLVDVLVRNANERHLQLHSNVAGEQAAFRDLRVAGALEPLRDDTDLLALTANNAGANKQDVHVGHALDWDVRLRELAVGPEGSITATRQATTSVLLENPLPPSGMHPWILESFDPGEGFGGGTGVPGLNRTWFSLWLPPEGEVVAGRGPDGALPADSDVVHGQRAVDVFLETPSRSRRSFRLETVSPVALSVHDGHLRYRATLWRQAKAIPDDVRLVVHAPTGWQVDTADLQGGGDGARPDLSTDPRPDDPEELAMTVDRDRVTVRGQMTADAHLVVDLVPADR